MNSLEREVSDIRFRLNELERRLAASSREGVIAEVSATEGLARVRLQDGDRPFLTDWLPWQEASAGANKTHLPPSVGQQVTIVSESGDLHDATIQGSLNSASNSRPSAAGDEYVLLSVGSAKIQVIGGGSEIVFSVGGVSLTISASGVATDGGLITHNGKDVGDTHKHAGVIKGPATTDVPV